MQKNLQNRPSEIEARDAAGALCNPEATQTTKRIERQTSFIRNHF
jgi:hypothetical protein